jgi:hypothetical protein
MDNKPKQQALNSLTELAGLINGHLDTIEKEKKQKNLKKCDEF